MGWSIFLARVDWSARVYLAPASLRSVVAGLRIAFAVDCQIVVGKPMIQTGSERLEAGGGVILVDVSVPVP
jgi:hypothetical protein